MVFDIVNDTQSSVVVQWNFFTAGYDKVFVDGQCVFHSKIIELFTNKNRKAAQIMFFIVGTMTAAIIVLFESAIRQGLIDIVARIRQAFGTFLGILNPVISDAVFLGNQCKVNQLLRFTLQVELLVFTLNGVGSPTGYPITLLGATSDGGLASGQRKYTMIGIGRKACIMGHFIAIEKFTVVFHTLILNVLNPFLKYPVWDDYVLDVIIHQGFEVLGIGVAVFIAEHIVVVEIAQDKTILWSAMGF